MSCANSSCKNCNGTCNTEQSFCTISSQSAPSWGGGFSWPTSPDVDVTIAKVWTAAAWNQLKAAISAAYASGAMCSSSAEAWSENPMMDAEQNQVITAEMYNSAVEAVSKFGGGASAVAKDDVIRNYHAINLESTYNGGVINPLACDECNVSCDVECDGCIGCVSCQGQQHYSTCYGSG